MKSLLMLLLVFTLFGCQGTRQKAIQSICKEVGQKAANCSKSMGMISSSVVENQFLNNTAPATPASGTFNLIEKEDSFSW